MRLEDIVKVQNESISIKVPYDPLFLKNFKQIFTKSERTWRSRENTWVVKYTEENLKLIRKIVKEHYFDVEEKLAIFRCEKSCPSINDFPLISYTRDYDSPKNSWCADVICYNRLGSTGSRRYPLFSGIVLAKVKIGRKTKIWCDGEYKIYPYTKMLHVSALELVKSVKSPDDYNKIVKTLDELSKAHQTSQEAVVIKGLLVISSLPSKALLENVIPKEFKSERIGREVIQVVRGYFYNKLGTLSRKFYNEILKKYGVFAGFGYIIPSYNLPAFITEVEKLRNEYKLFEEELRNFIEKGEVPGRLKEKAEKGRVRIDTEYINIVKEYLEACGIDKITVPDIADRVKIRLIPFSIDIDLIKEYLEDRTLDSVKRELDTVREEMVQHISKQFEERINAIFEKLKSYEKKKFTKTMVKKLREDINSIISTATEIGIETSRIKALKEILNTINDLEAEKIKKIEVSEKASGRLKALLKEIEQTKCP